MVRLDTPGTNNDMTLLDSMMGLVFRLFSPMRGLPSIRLK